MNLSTCERNKIRTYNRIIKYWPTSTGQLLKEVVAGGFYDMWMGNAFKRMGANAFTICGGQCF
jgi:hypothetical protein